MIEPAGQQAFFAGNREFVTRRLWGVANQAPVFSPWTVHDHAPGGAGARGRGAAATGSFKAFPHRRADAPSSS